MFPFNYPDYSSSHGLPIKACVRVYIFFEGITQNDASDSKKKAGGGGHVKCGNSEGDGDFNDNVPHVVLYSLFKCQRHYGVQGDEPDKQVWTE